MQVLATMCTWPCYAIEVNQAILVRSSIFVPDLVEYGALVELGEITLEVELGQVLNIGCILGSPAIRCVESLLPPCLCLGGMRGYQTNPASNNSRCPRQRLFCILEYGCVSPTITFAADS
jgi:hypothetical protein